MGPVTRRFHGRLRRPLWPLFLLIASAALIGQADFGLTPASARAAEAEEVLDVAPEAWTCSMHPQIILPSNDQKCPICFMDLIPLRTTDAAGLSPESLSLSEAAAALAEIETAPVQRRFVERQVRLTGKVAVAEDRLRSVTARYGGRLDRLYVAVTGQEVGAGDKLADIYSPDLYMAQAELLAAVANTSPGSDDGVVQAARERLRLWGLDRQQIDDIVRRGRPQEHIGVTAPFAGVVLERRATEGDYVATGTVLYTIADLSTIWVTFAALERDAVLLQPGQPVDFTTRAVPGRRFGGEVLFVEPVLQEATRSVAVRVAVDNPDGLLRPGMLATGAVRVTLDAQGRPAGPGAEPPLVIPDSAPLLTGDRAVVYVRQPGSGDPVFVGRQIHLGSRAGDTYLVVDGLREGEAVVTRGNFKIDSALQIMARPSMMHPGDASAAAMPAAHAHGQDGAAPVAEVTTAAAEGDSGVPPCFQERLAEIFTRYVALQAALAGDDVTAARSAAATLAEGLDGVACGGEHLPAQSAAVWTDLHARMAAALGDDPAQRELADYRADFAVLSDDLWQALTTFTDADQVPARRFFCPMAAGGAGAHWLQLDKQVANPYYGASMLRCGSEVATRNGERS